MENPNAQLDHDTVSIKLPIIGILIVVILIGGYILKPEPKAKYRLTATEMLEKAQAHEQIASPDILIDVLYENTALYQFIDLRSAQEYLNGHLPGAINIPVSKILDEEYESILNQEDHINILYANDQIGACGPWMVLAQLGYNNNLVLQGGYDYAKNYVQDKFAPGTGSFRDEKAKYDYARIMQEKAGGSSGKASETSTDAAPPVIINNTKPKKEEGGC